VCSSWRSRLRCNEQWTENCLHKGAGGRDKGDAGKCGLELGFGIEEEMSLAAGTMLGPYEVVGPLGIPSSRDVPAVYPRDRPTNRAKIARRHRA